MKPHIIAAIFARGGAKGIPGKNIRLLAGKPLIAYSIDTAKALPLIDRVIVSTDDSEIARVAENCGAEVPFMRPRELALDDSPEWLAWRHAIESLENGSLFRRMDIMVSIPTTSPLRKASDVQSCLDLLLQSDADAVVAVTTTNRNPYFNMVTRGEDGSTSLVIPTQKEIHRRQDAPVVYDMTTIAYAVRRDFVMCKDFLFKGKVKSVIVPVERSVDIDTELDFQIAEFLLKRGKN